MSHGGRGRGQFFKDKYGGGGGRGRRAGVGDAPTATPTGLPRSRDVLQRELQRMDEQSYGLYCDLCGTWDLGDRVLLHVDHVQGDPFASPSKIRVVLPQEMARYPPELFVSRIRRVAVTDYILRVAFWFLRNGKWDEAVANEGGGYHGAKGGDLRVLPPSQHVIGAFVYGEV